MRRSTLGALIGALFLTACQEAPEAPAQQITGKARFVDGDSGYLDQTKIRLRCVNSEEYTTQKGKIAAKFAYHHINGHRLSCIKRQKKESYGRIVVSCIFEDGENKGKNVNRFLVEAGQAEYTSPACEDEALKW